MELTPKVRAWRTFECLDLISPSSITFLTQKEPFELLISVIMSAQTTDKQVNEVAHELFSRYPNAFELAQADLEIVKQIIRSTGYYNAKAKHIVQTSQVLVKKFNGLVPLTMEELTTLPGVGRKTASVILGQIAGQPAIIVDTHFSRVVKRLGLTSANSPDTIEREVAKLLPPEHHYRFSMIVNLHGRKICHARNPQCEECPLALWCMSYPIQ